MQAQDTKGQTYQTFLDWLQSKGDIDFSYYRQSWIATHIEVRKTILGFEKTQDYLNYCHTHNQEYSEFLDGIRKQQIDNNILKIKYQALCSVLAQIKKGHFTKERPLRIWITGCRQGELAYLTAIAYLECDNATEIPVKIFATDLHEASIQQASKGMNQNSVAFLNDTAPFNKYLSDTRDGYYRFNRLRKMILFSVHDLNASPPFTSMDLIICKGMLWMYKIPCVKLLLTGFHNNLNPNGYLIVDPNDDIHYHQLGFTQEETLPGLYRKASPTKKSDLVEYTRSFNSPIRTNKYPPSLESILKHHPARNRYANYCDIMDTIIDEFVPPGLLLDPQGEILHVFSDTSEFLDLFLQGEFSKDLFSRLAEPLNTLLHNAFTATLDRKRSLFIDYEMICNWYNEHDTPPPQLELHLNYYKSKKQRGAEFCGVFFQRPSTTTEEA